jgi:hypothetical protein
MHNKPKPPAKHHPAPPAPPSAQNPANQRDARWQRTVRYGWDKGGSRGGRK